DRYLAIPDPVRVRGFEELPRHQRAVRLTALDRERRLGTALVATDQPELRSHHAVEHVAIDLCLAQWAGAGDQGLAGLEVGERLGAGGVPGEQRGGRGNDAADPI